MKKVYIINRYVSYMYPNTKYDDVCVTIDRVFDSEDKAIDYIRKGIVDWHESLVRRERYVEGIVDETRWSSHGERAYFLGTDGIATVFRNLYYTSHDVE